MINDAMTPVFCHDFADGPTMVLPYSQSHASFQFPSQSQQGLQSFESSTWSLGTSSIENATPGPSSWASKSTAKTTTLNPSRKRSRDQFTEGDEESGSSRVDQSVPMQSAPAEEPIYGPGMTLINPRTGLAISAESQTGTWYEEQAEKALRNAPVSSRRADDSGAPSRKAQRLDISAPKLDDISLEYIRKNLQRTDENGRDHGLPGSSMTLDEPRVDDVTRLLGISWQRVSHDDEMSPAVFGWERYINNHFDRYLRDARILLKNRSLNAYLVAALSIFRPSDIPSTAVPLPFDCDPSSSFFLFKEDLSEAQLIGHTWDRCLQNLRSVPMQFDSTEILRAAERSPERVTDNPTSHFANCTVGNGIPIARVSKEELAMLNGKGTMNGGTDLGVGMDMDVDM